MPSDDRVQLALRATARQRSVYRATLAPALARARAMLAANHGAERARQELGAFGAARIDAARFAELSRGVTLDANARTRVARAADVLRDCAEASDEELAIGVGDGRTPYAVVANAMSRWGRGFGAALAVDLVRAGQHVPAQHDRLTEVWRFEQWNRAHRMAAPPLVVVTPGSELRVAGLSEFLDGAQHLALVVEGDCPPAALVHHITPATLVLQTSDDTGLERFSEYRGPAIAALVPDSAACFLHDPDAGVAVWQRLSIWRRPTNRPRATLAGLSAAQQWQELLQLEALGAQPSLPVTAIEALAVTGAGDATDRLASWLLAQAGVSGGT